MHAIPHQSSAPLAGHPANDDGTLRSDMEASARAFLAADTAHVDEAMNSFDWERRGLLQRLTRRAR